MRDFPWRAGLKLWLQRLEPLIEGVLFVLSAAAILLVVINEFVTSPNTVVPWVNMEWSHLRNMLQAVIWSAFILDVALYGIVSRRPIAYAREHWIELIICVTWNPFSTGALLQHVHSLISLQTLVLVGSIAHLIRIARWASGRFSEHPMVVICTALLVLVTSASVMLMQVEPKTFATFQDAAFFVFMTVFTVGSDLNPQTLAGRVVTCVMTAGGIALGTVFLSTMAPLIGKKLFPGQNINERLLKKLADTRETMQLLLAEQKASNELTNRRLALLEEQVRARCNCHKTEVIAASADADCHEVWRQDDNGNQSLVQGGLSKAAADDLAKEYTDKGHKQMYWVRPCATT